MTTAISRSGWCWLSGKENSSMHQKNLGAVSIGGSSIFAFRLTTGRRIAKDSSANSGEVGVHGSTPVTIALNSGQADLIGECKLNVGLSSGEASVHRRRAVSACVFFTGDSLV
ncbi:hypothetical protein C8U37_1242 [Trichococcus patagoniensis]|uniref:Uncharacterized protein n=1 Tax=Trichococcus patagoniensis TaxID=382641 RepID=A0A2T5IB91_9LACT|nr:hypothetical protein C8U37_1242 [Trichococcus patagoniensis]